MSSTEWGAAIAVAALLAGSAAFLLRRAGRRRLEAERAERLARLFSAAEEQILDRDFPRWRALPAGLRQAHAGTTRVLMEEKNYEPCGGLAEVTEEMKLVIAAQAAILLVGHDSHRFLPHLKSILVYPGGFRDLGSRRFGIDEERRGVLQGESWETGSVVLSWESVVAGGRCSDDGINVVIHEIAHQLDQYNSIADGVPKLAGPADYARWSEVLGRGYRELVEQSKIDEDEPFLDPYGATHPCEFFAVLSEAFVETPGELLAEHPDLYGELASFYGLDPAAWDQ